MASNWLAYNDLAWTEDWLADPASQEEEAQHYVDLLKQHCPASRATLLHLGSGAGNLDRLFKQHFTVTGVDLSAGMLARARAAHPEIQYLEADMRSLRLDTQFDAVAIPDSIDYMVTQDDLAQAIHTAKLHLKPEGVLLVVGKTAETFQNNNFAYAGEKDGIHITLLENNHILDEPPQTYEAILVYLIRQRGSLRIHTDRHVLGLFSQACWEKTFRDEQMSLAQSVLDGVYAPYLLADGAYPMQVFLAKHAASPRGTV